MAYGIYKLNFKNTEKVYIGQSSNIERRFRNHLYSLSKGISPTKLQEAYYKYGIPELEILVESDELDTSKLDEIEEEAISIFNSIDNGFNTCNVAYGSSSKGRKGNTACGENANAAIYPKGVYIDIFYALINNINKLSVREIAEMLNVSYSVVSSIRNLNTHKWLKIEFPDEYTILEELHNSYDRTVNRTAESLGLDYPKLLSPLGEEVTVTNLSEFSKIHNLSIGNLHGLLNNTRKSVNGWSRLSDPITIKCTLVSPVGTKYDIPHMGIAKFCREHKLTPTYISQLISGKKRTYKGWSIANHGE